MLDKLFTTPHEVDMAILTLLACIIAVAIGKGGGKLLIEFLKKMIGHGDVNVNVGGGDMAGKQIRQECRECGLMVDPAKCPLHADEHGRSLRNEKDIGLLKEDLAASRTRLWEKLDSMEGTLTEIKVAVAGLCVESKYQKDLRDTRPRGGR